MCVSGTLWSHLQYVGSGWWVSPNLPDTRRSSLSLTLGRQEQEPCLCPLGFTYHCFLLHIGFSPELDRSMGLTCHAQPVGSGRVEEVSRKCQVGLLLLGALVSLKAELCRHTRPRRGVHGWMVPPGVLRKERPGTWPGLLRTQ